MVNYSSPAKYNIISSIDGGNERVISLKSQIRSKAIIDLIDLGNSYKRNGAIGKTATKVLTMKHLERGMARLAEEAPSRFGNVVTGDSDAIDADAFIQCAIFGKLVYG